MAKNLGECCCADGGCPCCKGHCGQPACVVLYRVDMADLTGTPMCDGCSCDAMDSGLFVAGETKDEHEYPAGWEHT